jgi:hypothetical protein
VVIHFPTRVLAMSMAVVSSVSAAGSASAQTPDSPRMRLMQALEGLIAAEPSGHTTHDDGEWLQLAVTDSITRGDREIERLAVRAASPLRARVTSPVSGTHDLPSLEVNADTVLRVPRPINYRAQVLGALDGGEFVPIYEAHSGGRSGVRIERALGPAAAVPGFHTLRMKALLRFGDGQTNGDASWTETRELPTLFYAIYDIAGPPAGTVDIRALVYGPAGVPVKTFDTSLDSQPFALWLATVLSTRRNQRADPGPDWISQFCSERTAEAGVIPDRTGVCAVVYFQAVSRIGQIWFRTAEAHVSENAVRWDVLPSPQFEGFVIGESAPESTRLSALPAILDADPTLRPIGDVAISPDDIRVTSSDRAADQPVSVAITVRDQGTGDLFKVLVRVTLTSSPTDKGVSRQFVVDIPAQGSTEITLQSAFPAGYGVIVAHALQLTEHSPFENWTPDPTPEDACAFRVVNPRLAPPRYIDSFGDTSGCPGK